MPLSCTKKFVCIIKRNNRGNFYYLNCLHSFIIEIKLKSHEKVCKNKEFCGIVMPSEKDKPYRV